MVVRLATNDINEDRPSTHASHKSVDAFARDDERKNAEHFGSAQYKLAEAFKTMDVILLNTKETSLNTQ